MRIVNFEKIYGQIVDVNGQYFRVFEDPAMRNPVDPDIKFSVGPIDGNGNSLPGIWFQCYLTDNLFIEWWNTKGILAYSQMIGPGDLRTHDYFLKALIKGLKHLEQTGITNYTKKLRVLLRDTKR